MKISLQTRFVNSVVFLCLFIFIYLSRGKEDLVLGGSLSFYLLPLVFTFTLYFCREIQLEMALGNLLTLAVIGINWLHYEYMSGVFTSNITLWAFLSIVGFLFFLFHFYIFRSLRVPEISTDIHARNAYLNFSLGPLILTAIPIVYSLCSGLVFLTYFEKLPLYESMLNIIPVSLIFPVAFWSAFVIALKHYDESQFRVAFKENDVSLPEKEFIKYYLLLMLFIFIIGSGLEIRRGEWLLWIESIALINVTVLFMALLFKKRTNPRGDNQTAVKLEIRPGILIAYVFIIIFGAFCIIFSVDWLILKEIRML